jgi:hypothetical protein
MAYPIADALAARGALQQNNSPDDRVTSFPIGGSKLDLHSIQEHEENTGIRGALR